MELGAGISYVETVETVQTWTTDVKRRWLMMISHCTSYLQITKMKKLFFFAQQWKLFDATSIYMTYLLNFYVSAFTNTKTDHTHPIWYNFTKNGCSLMSCPGYWLVRLFTLVHQAKCHSTLSRIMSSYIPIPGFKATLCTSTGDIDTIESNHRGCMAKTIIRPIDHEKQNNHWESTQHCNIP